MADNNNAPDIAKVATASALSLGILYAACWLGAQFNFPAFSASHNFIQLFTAHPVTSLAALAEGALAALAAGAVGGFLWAYLYKILPVGRASR